MYYLLKLIKFSVSKKNIKKCWENGENTGKAGKSPGIGQSGKVGTMKMRKNRIKVE